MLSIGWGEILLIGAVALVVVGPERLPTLMRTLGRAYGQVRRAADELRRAFVLEADRVDAEERLEALETRRRRAADARKAAQQAAGEGTVIQQEPTPSSDGSPDEQELVEVSHGVDDDDDDDYVHAEGDLSEGDDFAAEGAAPGGFSEAEWAELPPHLQQAVLKSLEDKL